MGVFEIRKASSKRNKKTGLFISCIVVSTLFIFSQTSTVFASNLIFQSGFETGNFSQWTQHGNCIITTNNPFSGTYCMRTLGGHTGQCINNGYADKNFGEDYQTIYALTYVKLLENPHDTDVNTNNFLFLVNYHNSFDMVAAVGLYNDSGNFKWSLGYADGGWGYSAKTTEFMNPTLNVWYSLELKVVCGHGSAEYQVWLNGVELSGLHVTNADSVASSVNYLEIGDSLFMQDYDSVTVSTQYISTSHYDDSQAMPTGSDSVQTVTGTGMATVTTSAGVITDLSAVPENTIPSSGRPSNMIFPHGFLSFNIEGLTSGQSVTIEMVLPENVPVGSQYWKFQNGQWTQLSMGSDNGDNVISVSITDGGVGDSDGVANGVIADPGGIGLNGTNFVVPETPFATTLLALLTSFSAFILIRRVAKAKV
jgi:hypothetical protein